jgi:predicted secreted protein
MSYTYKYYLDKQSADLQYNDFSLSDSQIQTQPNYATQSVGGFSSWRITDASTGSSSKFNAYGETGDFIILNNNGDYWLYPGDPFTLLYYPTQADALARTNLISSANDRYNYTIETTGGYSSWKIASNSTGSSLQTGIYLTNDSLNNSGIYYLYPTPASVNTAIYYPTEADALAGTNSIGTGASLVIESIGGYFAWKIASNSTGTSSQSDVYTVNNTLNDDGNYNLYPAPIFISYYLTESDALANTNILDGNVFNYTVEAMNNIVRWQIASNSTGTSSRLFTYVPNDVLNNDGLYYLYPAGQTPCFLEGTTILCKVDDVESYLPIETIKPGTLVKTSLNGYKKVELIGKGNINNPGNNERIEKRLYKCSTNKYAELKEDLYITGCHSILVDNLTNEQREQTIRQSGKVFVTDKKYRLMACIDKRAEPWCSEGTYTIWHVALENNDIKMNYGVYANGGLLVETCSINYMRTKADMQLIS